MFARSEHVTESVGVVVNSVSTTSISWFPVQNPTREQILSTISRRATLLCLVKEICQWIGISGLPTCDRCYLQLYDKNFKMPQPNKSLVYFTNLPVGICSVVW